MDFHVYCFDILSRTPLAILMFCGSQLPANMPVTWNKKMRKTAGYCVTGEKQAGGCRYARIEMSEKVCDSAGITPRKSNQSVELLPYAHKAIFCWCWICSVDRLRDTLIHEMCHAATWLINGVRDGHGSLWKLHARKATVVHPELPMVTRCHSYDIKYKFQYQCTRCKNTYVSIFNGLESLRLFTQINFLFPLCCAYTITFPRFGRHSKSLDTQKFACALCTGQLVLLTPSKPRAATPFAVFVKENYGTARQELAGQSHAEVMRKLSADFASKTKLSQTWTAKTFRQEIPQLSYVA